MAGSTGLLCLFAQDWLHDMLHINEIPVQAFISINPLLFNGIVSNVMIESLAHNNASKQRSADIL
jgi:hypothetical protein